MDAACNTRSSRLAQADQQILCKRLELPPADSGAYSFP
jgi:hypothetical protein